MTTRSRRRSFAPRRGAAMSGQMPEEPDLQDAPEPQEWSPDVGGSNRALAFALLGQFMQQGMLTAQALSVCEQVSDTLSVNPQTPDDVFMRLDNLADAYQSVVEAQGYLLGALNNWAGEEAG